MHKQKVKEFSTTKTALQQMIQGLKQEIQKKKEIYKIKPQEWQNQYNIVK